ncbi:MAG TPA: hypothetical protein PK373_03825 [Sedimentisphaerales bacterium]|nr:hypothetical protein [Phycisphaerae bacterium]HON90796.1 hypothetical protein [Sedimentisphaerales bacterium]HQG48195.1 hypothetical protein [Sedimentisphaerales bacterium]
MQRRMVTIGMAAGILALAIAGLCVAQPQAGGNRGNRGERGAGGNFDPAQMRQRMMERWKEQLGADDESWKVIEPRLTKVMELSRDAMAGGRGGMFGGMGMRGGPGGAGGRGGEAGNRPRFPGEEDRQPTAVEKAAEALSATLENQSASAETIKQQLTALRAAKVKAQQDLANAQQELRQILTVRQEAQLVLSGMLN